MGTTLLKIKIMPEQKSDLKQLKNKIKENIQAEKGKVDNIKEEEVAFGLKSLIVTIIWPEEQETEKAESAIRKIKQVSSLDVIDYRRAFG